MKDVKRQTQEDRLVQFKELQITIKVIEESSASATKIIDLTSKKGASCWLTSLPLQKWGFVFNKQEFPQRPHCKNIGGGVQ